MRRQGSGFESTPRDAARRSGALGFALALPCGVGLASLLLAGSIPALGEEDVPAGQVVGLHGSVFAQSPDGELRALGCRDPIYPGERVVSDEGARVGLLVGDLAAQLGASSELLVADEAGNADLVLEKGAVRVVDPREEGPRFRLLVLDTRAEVLGNDVEGHVFQEKTGRFAMLCEWERPLSVARLEESQVAPPGHCAIAKRHEALYVTQGHDERVGSPTQDHCPLPPVWGPISRHLSPSDVAAGPPAERWSSIPTLGPMPRRSPCDVPGSGCNTVIELPAPTGDVPGGSGRFPGL